MSASTGSVVTLIGVILISCNLSLASADESTVSVIGTGPSVDEAKSDAIRQALQETVQQLVVASRAVTSNQVLRDKVMSTMNGYIDKFVTRNVSKAATGYSVSADVTVSTSRIENFIGIATSTGGEVTGGTLLEEQSQRLAQEQAEVLQREARGEIFDNILRGFPAGASQLEVLKIDLSSNDPHKLNVELKFSYKPTFIEALEGTVKALSAAPCVPRNREILSQGHSGDIISSIGRYTYIDFCNGTSAANSAFFGKYSVVCFGKSNTIDCFALQPGIYCRSCRLSELQWEDNSPLAGILQSADVFSPRLVIYGRFIDSGGQSANANGPCLVNLVKPDRGQASDIAGGFVQTFIKKYVRADNIMLAGFDLQPKYGITTIDTSLVDLSRAKHFVAVAGFSHTSGFDEIGDPTVANLVPDRGEQANGCALLDEAVNMYMLSTAQS
jgi:hypothetical protein